jgi:hypothetical protein
MKIKQSLNSDRIDADLVNDKFNNEAYDNVKKVSDNISTVVTIASAINDGIFDNVNIIVLEPLKSSIMNVSDNSSSILLVANNISDINILAPIAEDISIVANNIQSLIDNLLHIITVSQNISSVIDVSDDIANINNVALNIGEINIASSNIFDINNVSSNISSINSLYSNINDIIEVQDNISSIQNASQNAADSLDNKNDSEKLAIYPTDSLYTLSDGVTNGYSAKHYHDKASLLLDSKQDVLVSGSNIKTINKLDIVGSGNLDITLGSGGYAGNVYFTELVSSTNPSYKQISYIPDVAETILSVVVNNSEALIGKYIYDSEIDTTSIPAGEWGLHLHRWVDNTAQSTSIRFEIFKRTSAGVETVLFSVSTNDINDTNRTLETLLVTKNAFGVNATDKLGIAIYGSTTRTSNTTINIVSGDGEAAFLVTPLQVRHSLLRARDEANSHPISAITNLQTILDDKVVKNTSIIPSTGTKVTYDSKGLITGSESLSNDDIPSISSDKIISGVLPVARGGTGVASSTGNGSVVLNDSPVLITPILGVSSGVSFNGLTGLSNNLPLNSGIKNSGTSNEASRADHVHESQSSVSGNAGTATKLLNARNINGVPFDGTSDVVISSGNSKRKNYLINGNFQFWDYATSQELSSGYGSDNRFQNNMSGSSRTHSRIESTDVERAFFESPYYSRTVVTSVAGASNFVFKLQNIEDVTKLAGKTVTLSFWARADSNKNISIEQAKNFGTSNSNPTFTSLSENVNTVNLTTTWQKKSVTMTIPSLIGKTIGSDGVHTSMTHIIFWFDAGSNLSSRTNSLGQQSGTFDIAEVKLEDGSVATEGWSPYDGEWGSEAVARMRYYEVIYNYQIFGVAGGNNSFSVMCLFKQDKRIIPSITEVNNVLGGGTTLSFSQSVSGYRFGVAAAQGAPVYRYVDYILVSAEL